MATRIYCDHCGSTCRSPNVFCYGPVLYYQGSNAQTNVGILGVGAGQSYYQISPPPPTPQKQAVATKQLDLCDRCVPIWMDRVDKLTKHDERV